MSYKKSLAVFVIVFFGFFCNCLPAYRPTPFVVEILTYNNQDDCVGNLRSVLDQDYDNFRVILINDASTDRTDANIRKVLGSHPQAKLVKYIKNKKRAGAMANHMRAIYSCKDDEVVVQVDGDDFLRHPHVLKKLDRIYQNKNVWVTYGSHILLSSGIRGPYSSPIPEEILKSGTIRRYKWCTSHLRTFYAALFKKIAPKDFKYKNQLVRVACDIAFMLPIIEMASVHAYYVDDLLYIYNDLSDQNDHKLHRDLVIATTNYLRRLPIYNPIASLTAEKAIRKKSNSLSK
jgi:glycosyltransferase involved in cell wall biosynthesis